MASSAGPVVEVCLLADPAVVPELDTWLTQALTEDRIADDCNVVALAAEDGQARRLLVVRYADDAEPDGLPDTSIRSLLHDLAERFDSAIEVQTRLLIPADEVEPEEPAHCLNCNEILHGQYCGNCGQRARTRLISLWELITDAFGDLFELDSRLWQTLIPLLFRPGQLTHDYLQGRRARFMPPFRMYLVLSLLFFVVAFFDPTEEFGLLLEPEAAPVAAAETEAAEEVTANPGTEAAQEVIDELIAEGVIDSDELNLEANGEGRGFRILTGEDGDAEVSCELDERDGESLPPWLQRRLTPERLQHFCKQILEDNGAAFLRNVIDNVPVGLILLLPLLAFVLKALYPLSRRYYVEHLLFFLHFHAFFFLLLTVQIMIARIGSWWSPITDAATLVVVFLSFYYPIYLFIAMRKVYGQSRWLTFLKYLLLTVSYLFGFTVVMLAVFLLAALKI